MNKPSSKSQWWIKLAILIVILIEGITVGVFGWKVGSIITVSLVIVGIIGYPIISGRLLLTERPKEQGEGTKPTRKGLWILGVIGVALVAILVTWWVLDSKYQDQLKAGSRGSGVQVVQPAEEWVFSQVENGQERSFEVEITKREEDKLYAVIQEDHNGQKLSVGGLRLNRVGENWRGTWNNYLDNDHGDCSLYRQTHGYWGGTYTLQNGKMIPCWLKVRYR